MTGVRTGAAAFVGSLALGVGGALAAVADACVGAVTGTGRLALTGTYSYGMWFALQQRRVIVRTCRPSRNAQELSNGDSDADREASCYVEFSR